MRILLVNPFPLEGLGSGTYTKNLADELAQLGHKAKVIIPEHEPYITKILKSGQSFFTTGKIKTRILIFLLIFHVSAPTQGAVIRSMI